MISCPGWVAGPGRAAAAAARPGGEESVSASAGRVAANRPDFESAESPLRSDAQRPGCVPEDSDPRARGSRVSESVRPGSLAGAAADPAAAILVGAAVAADLASASGFCAVSPPTISPQLSPTTTSLFPTTPKPNSRRPAPQARCCHFVSPAGQTSTREDTAPVGRVSNEFEAWLSVRWMWCSAPAAPWGKNPAMGNPWD